MRRRTILAILTLILALILPLTVAADDPPTPTTRHQYRLDGLPITGPAEIFTQVFETQPGSRTPQHTHPGLVLGTVFEGELTMTVGGVEKTYTVGQSFTEPPGVVAIAHNRGTVRSRVFGTMVLPKGAAPSTTEPGEPPAASPAPVSLYVFRTDAVLPAGAYEVAHTVNDFVPGAQTPLHTHPGQVVSTVLAGEITFITGGTTKVYKMGENFIELPGSVGQARNAGSAPATVLSVYLLPKGVPLSAPVAPTPPSTGTGGNLPGMPSTGAGGGSQTVPLGWLSLLAGTGTLALGWYLRRRVTRRRGSRQS
ncbi:MAG: cupin domain-containing protein [Thermomicrobiales bacterium]